MACPRAGCVDMPLPAGPRYGHTSTRGSAPVWPSPSRARLRSLLGLTALATRSSVISYMPSSVYLRHSRPAFSLPCQATADVAPTATDPMSCSPAPPGLDLPAATPVPLASDAEVLGAASEQESVPIVCDPIFCARLRKEGWQQLLHDENVSC